MEKEPQKPQKKSKTAKKIKRGIKNMGLNIDKNEYMEIILSNSNHPEATYSNYKNN